MRGMSQRLIGLELGEHNIQFRFLICYAKIVKRKNTLKEREYSERMTFVWKKKKHMNWIVRTTYDASHT